MDTSVQRCDILMLGTFSAWSRGTIQSRALPFARQLQHHGLNVCIVTTPWDQPQEAGYVDHVAGIPIIHSAARPDPIGPVTQMTRLTRDLQPRAIHLIKPKGYGGLASLLVRSMPAQRPYLIVDTDDWEGDGGWNDISDYGPLQRRVSDWQERHLISRADHVVVASRLLESRARSLRKGKSSSEVTFIPNGLDGEWLGRLRSTAPTREGRRDRRIVIYSRFVEFPDGWLENFATELARAIHREAELLVVGASDEPRSVRSGSGQVSMHFTGYLPRRLVPGLLRSASVAIYPYQDSLITRAKQSVKLLELMAAGCAIVASNVGEVATTLGQTGELVEGHDPSAFAGAVARLLDEPGHAAQLGGTACERVQDHFDIAALAPRLVAVYQRLGLLPA